MGLLMAETGAATNRERIVKQSLLRNWTRYTLGRTPKRRRSAKSLSRFTLQDYLDSTDPHALERLGARGQRLFQYRL
jgi:hypothetical protein